MTYQELIEHDAKLLASDNGRDWADMGEYERQSYRDEAERGYAEKAFSITTDGRAFTLYGEDERATGHFATLQAARAEKARLIEKIAARNAQGAE
jgi:23S rRNA G2069 N7-methylase RlmK/C1962 C5-methylase RlmI